MSRLTIVLSQARYRALKEASVQRDKTIGQLIDESLDFHGIKSRQDARDLVRRARAHSRLSEEGAGRGARTGSGAAPQAATGPAVIVDIHVVVAGLLTPHPASPVARILDGMLTAAFPFVVSEALLAEYRTVLARPNLRKFHGLTVAEVEVILTDLAQHARYRCTVTQEATARSALALQIKRVDAAQVRFVQSGR